MILEQFLREVAVFFQKNSNWIIPVAVTAIFAFLNLKATHANLKISENQKRLQNDMFCYQLYEKRLSVYTGIQNTLSEILQEGKSDINSAAKFLHCTREVPFLFGDDIKKLIDEIYQLILELDRYCTLVDDAIRRQSASGDHTENCQKEYELKSKIHQIMLELDSKFQDYIGFGDFKIEEITEVSK